MEIYPHETEWGGWETRKEIYLGCFEPEALSMAQRSFRISTLQSLKSSLLGTQKSYLIGQVHCKRLRKKERSE